MSSIIYNELVTFLTERDISSVSTRRNNYILTNLIIQHIYRTSNYISQLELQPPHKKNLQDYLKSLALLLQLTFQMMFGLLFVHPI